MADGRKIGEKILFLAPGIQSYLLCQIRLQGKHCPHLPPKGWALVKFPKSLACFLLFQLHTASLQQSDFSGSLHSLWKANCFDCFFPLPLLNYMLNGTFFSPIPLSLYFPLIPQNCFYSSTFYVVLTHMSTYVHTYIRTYSHT